MIFKTIISRKSTKKILSKKYLIGKDSHAKQYYFLK